MESVPPRGSGWVCRLQIVDFRLPIGVIPSSQSTIGNWQSAIDRPTRYREVVLTSSREASPCDLIRVSFSLSRRYDKLKLIGHQTNPLLPAPVQFESARGSRKLIHTAAGAAARDLSISTGSGSNRPKTQPSQSGRRTMVSHHSHQYRERFIETAHASERGRLPCREIYASLAD
jgi:hypothetical protein